MKNLIFDGPAYDSSGIAAFIRQQAKSFARIGYKVAISKQEVPYSLNLDKELRDVMNNDLEVQESTVIQVGAEHWPPLLAQHPKKFYGYIAIEGTKLPQHWVEAINDPDVDGVLAMSNALKNMWIANGAEGDKITVIGHGIDPKLFNPEVEAKDYTPLYPEIKEKFVFGYLNGWDLGKGANDRKGPEILLQAFVEEFGKDNNVALLFKPNLIYGKEKDMSKAIKALNIKGLDKCNILMDGNNYKETELAGIYKAMDCYISPTKGEGFGITIAEAMACGVPVIVPNDPHSGHMDFCNEDTAHLFKVDGYEPIDSRTMGFFYSGSEWAMPSVKDLRKVMRKVYEDRTLLRSKVQVAYDLINKDYTWDACTKRIRRAIE